MVVMVKNEVLHVFIYTLFLFLLVDFVFWSSLRFTEIFERKYRVTIFPTPSFSY